VSDDSVWARPTEAVVSRPTEPNPSTQLPAKSLSHAIKAGEVLLRASQITRTFQRGSELVNALNGAELDLARGEFVALVGRSGSGKTTLLNVLCGWEPPDGGMVSWKGTTVSMADVRWESIALVPQSPGLLEDLSVRENVGLPRRLRRDPETAPDDAMSVVLHSLGLEHLSERFPDEISLGEQQRVSVARALIVSPDVLLADEPTAHQDAVSMDKVLDAIRTLVASGGACLVASHSSEVLDIADRVLEIRDGQITQRRR